MLWFMPEEVLLGSRRLGEVERIVVHEKAASVVSGYEPTGRSPTFVDVTQKSATFEIVRAVKGTSRFDVRVGDFGVLSFRSRPEGRTRADLYVAATVMVTQVKYAQRRGDGLEETTVAVAYEQSASGPLITIQKGA